MGPVIVHHLGRDEPEPAGPPLHLGGGVEVLAPAPGYICRWFWSAEKRRLYSLDDASNAAPRTLRDARALLSQAPGPAAD